MGRPSQSTRLLFTTLYVDCVLVSLVVFQDHTYLLIEISILHEDRLMETLAI